MKNYMIVFCLLISLLFIGCTNKNSFLGFNGSNFNFYDVTLPDSCFTLAYTWGDSIKVFSENNKLLLGNYDGAEIRTLIKFGSIPKVTNSSDIINSSIFIKFKIKTHLYNSNFRIDLYTLNKTWYENECSWDDYQKDSTWTHPGGDYNELLIKSIVFDTQTDTLSIQIPASVLYNWGQDSNTNHGILLKTYETTFNHLLELYSSETSTPPTLEFSYKVRTVNNNQTVETTKTYKSSALIDTYIHNAPDYLDTDDSQLSLWNIQPRSIALKFNIPLSVFQTVSPEIHDMNDLKKITINRANLILYKKNDDLPNTETVPSIGVGIYQEEISNQTYFEFNKIDFFSVSTENLHSDSLAVKITGPIQTIISKTKSNNGLIIRSNYKNKDFNRLNFYTINDPNPSQRPKIRIKFSTLKD